MPERKTCLLEFIEKRNIEEAKIKENIKNDPNSSYANDPTYWEEHWKPVPVWHGTRRKEMPQTLKRRGFGTFTCDEAKKEMFVALKAFGKLDVLAESSKKGNFLRGILDHTCRFENQGLYVDAFDEKKRTEGMSGFDQTCGYAVGNPEIIADVLTRAGINRWEAYKYLKERFGTPYKIKMVYRTPEDINLSTGCHWFEPSDIEEITVCPEPKPEPREKIKI